MFNKFKWKKSKKEPTYPIQNWILPHKDELGQWWWGYQKVTMVRHPEWSKNMSDKYKWHRVHKSEEYYEREICDQVWEHIMTHFGVDNIVDITPEQIQEVQEWRDEWLNEYSVLQVGFSNFMQMWESERWDAGLE
jgi:hypothetical protein